MSSSPFLLQRTQTPTAPSEAHVPSGMTLGISRDGAFCIPDGICFSSEKKTGNSDNEHYMSYFSLLKFEPRAKRCSP